MMNRRIDFKLIAPALLLWLSHLILSMQAVYTTNSNAALINSLIVVSYTVLCIAIIWSHCDFDSFAKYANYIGLFCCLYLFLQAIFLALGLNPPSGRLFNLPLLDYAGFVSTTWGFRLNSVFQEPSYFAIYLLPLLVINMQKQNYKFTMLIILALVMSSSSLGVIGSALVIVYYLLIEKKNIRQFIVIIVLALIVHLIMYRYSDYYVTSITRTIDKAMLITDVSNDGRFSGQIGLYQYLPVINQISGVGVNQLKNYFASMGLDVSNYSNSFVATLINSGIIGLISYIIFIGYTMYKSFKYKKIIFALIFIMIAATDYFIYNTFFFYLLTFIYVCSERRLVDEDTVRDTAGTGNKFLRYHK